MASLEEIRAERIKKLNDLKEKGINPYPISSGRTHTIESAIKFFDALSEAEEKVVIAGRVMAKRGQGGLIFIDLFDGTGKIQGLLKEDTLSASDFSLFKETTDVGDFIEIPGKLFVTKQGEKTIEAATWKMLSKSLRPLPDKWHGLQDIEERFRRRYLDSLMDDAVRGRFLIRSRLVSSLRRFLDSEGFVEMETSILQTLAGGATATPFKTHHEALDMDLYLRLAPELDLKKMLIGGFPYVYEIGRCFRNEGIDHTHNPEFTMLEAYAAFSDAEKERNRLEEMFRFLVKDLFDNPTVSFAGQEIDFNKPFVTIKYLDLIKDHTGLDALEASAKDLSDFAAKEGIKIDPSYDKAKIVDHIYKKFCRPKIIQPTFLIDYPAEFFPLAKRKEDDPNLIDAFQLLIVGIEVVKGFSELNDPIDQRDRFKEQEKNKARGDQEAQPNDLDFIEALEYGMPPASGWGIGIDRLAMLFTDTDNIKEVIYFPTLRPKNEE